MTVPAALADRLQTWEEHYLRREPEVRAFVDEPDRFTRVRAEVAHSVLTAPLSGLLLGVKDVFHVEGLPTRAGSELPVSELAGDEGPCVRALRAAGAIVAGKTVSTEFAYFAPGPTRNPHDPSRTPGGSSSGSAAAVAAELCDLALGTQTIGSIGRPAAFCGVVGWKPSYGRISRDGLIPLAPSLDHVGMFARDVATIERGAAVAVADWRGAGAARRVPRLGVPAGPYFDALSAAGREHFERSRALLERSGLEIVEVPAMPDFAAIAERHRRLVAFEAAEVHAEWFARFGELYAEKTAELIRRGQAVEPAQAERDRTGRQALRAELEGAMDEHGLDLWLSPPAVGPAPLGLDSTGDPVMNLPWTHAGLPTIVLPAGGSAAAFGESLPMGIQLAARFGLDEELLAWSRKIEAQPTTAPQETR
jgi:Asp-tRNA(Asn)/Glu-tRNA(Gln) amidotransferase A subunit family amidase